MAYDWDIAVPDPTESRKLGDDRIRSIKSVLRQVLRDGPMSNFPNDAKCTRGWVRIMRVDKVSDLPAAENNDSGLLYYVSADTDVNKRGLWYAGANQWIQVSRKP